MIKWLMNKLQPMETRASAAGYTGQMMAARDSFLSSRHGIAELTSTVQSCVSLWEGAFALADVQGTDLLTRRSLALAARSVALNGEAVFLIGDRGLIPATDWDLTTRDGEPRAYRLTIPEAGAIRTITALAAEVIHLRIGADPASPWVGTAPLRRSSLTGGLLHTLETALSETFANAPLGSLIVPLPDTGADDMASMRAAFRGRRGSTLVIEGVAQATAAGMNPQIGQKSDQLSPDLSKSMTAETLTAARSGIMSAFGVLPALFNQATTGPVVREAQRHLAGWTLQPIAMLLSEEATAKLGSDVMIDTMRPVQAYDVGGRARALSAIIKTMAEAKAAGLTEPEMNTALTLVNWGEGDNAA